MITKTPIESAQRRVLSIEEAGRLLGLSRAAAYAHAKAGTIPVIRLGRRVLVPKAALERLLEGPAPSQGAA